MIKQTRRFALPAPKLVHETVQETELLNDEEPESVNNGSTSDSGSGVHDEYE